MADRRVIFDFLGRTNDLDRALDHITRRMADLDGKFTSSSRAMASIGAAAVSVAGPVLAAGAAFAGFAAVAAPSIAKVITAQENLAESWETLSERQRVSAVSVKGLTDSFDKLAESYQPQALAFFDTVLGAVKAELPTFEKLVKANSGAMQDFADNLAGFVQGPLDKFLRFAADTGPKALGTLGNTMTTTGELALTLIQDTAPLGLSLLQVANGGLGAANALAQMNPQLTQLAIGTLLLRGPIGAVSAGAASMATRFREAAGAGAGLSRSAKLANLAAAAGPALWVTAAAAVGYFAIKAVTAKQASDRLAETLKAQYGAVGNNIAGYQQLTAELGPKLSTTLAELTKTMEAVGKGNNTTAHSVRELADAAAGQNKALEGTKEAYAKVTAGADALAVKYGITKDQALQLATAAGVDLSKAMDDAGVMSASATLKIVNYRAAVDQAKDPTYAISEALKVASDEGLKLKDRMNALAVATDAVFTPALNAFNAATQLKEGFAQLSEQLDKAKGRMDGNSEASRQLRNTFGQQLSTLNTLFDATFKQTGITSAATRAIKDQLPVLMALTGGDKQAMKAVEGLALKTGDATNATNSSRKSFLAAAESMKISKSRAEDLWEALQQIKSRKITVEVSALGKWAATAHKKFDDSLGFYNGGPIPASVPGASRNHDSVPAMLRVDEHVWTPEEVDQVGGHQAMYRLRAAARRGMLQGYSKGGRVSLSNDTRSNAAVLGDLMQPIRSGYSAMIGEIARVFAAAWKAFASGGGIVAAARSQIGTPYSWGGGGPGGPSTGIGRGAGTVGFDCSGLTEYAWWKGKGVRIGGTTYEQHPNSVPTAKRPGALGFPHMGHVVIASNRPGMVIEAPFTGGFVREVSKSMSDWRWPKGAGYAAGGQVRKWGQDFVGGYTVGGDRMLMEMAGIAGGRRRARGGPVVAGVPYLVGERGAEVYTPRAGGTVAPAGGVTVVQHNTLHVHVPLGAQKAEIGREVTEALEEYRRRGGRLAG